MSDGINVTVDSDRKQGAKPILCDKKKQVIRDT